MKADVNALLQEVKSDIDQRKFSEADSKINDLLNNHPLSHLEKAEVYHLKGRVKFNLGEFSQGTLAAEKEIDLLEMLENKQVNLSDAYLIKAYNLHMLKEFKQAFDNYKMSLELAKFNFGSNHEKIDTLLYACANILFHYLGEYQYAKEFYTQARDNAKLMNDQKREAFFETHIGMANRELKKYNEGLIHCKKAIELLSDENDPTHMFTVLEIALIQFELQKFEDLIETLKPVLTKLLEHEDPFAFAGVRLLLAEVLNETTLSNGSIEFLRGVMTEHVEPLIIIDYVIKNLDETSQKRHLINAYVVKAKITKDRVDKLLARAKLLALEEREVPIINMVRDTCEKLGIDYNSF